MGETQRFNTGRSSEFADTAGGSNGLSLAFAEINYTGGIQGFGAIADVTGVTISFTLSVAGPVQFFGSGASLANPFIQGNYLGLAINVNGTDYNLNGTGEQGFNSVGGGNLVVSGFTSGDAISAQRTLSLAAGSYTVKLRAFGNGYLESSVNFPTRLTAVYPVLTGAAATASPLTSQETGPFANTVNPVGTEYAVASGSTITVILSSTQTIVMSAYAHFIDPGSNSVSGNVGIRVTSPGPVTTDYDGSQARGGNDVNYAGSSILRTVQLTAGTHTFELITRNPASGAQYQFANGFLTVIYTVPQAVPPSNFAFTEATATSGEFDTTSATFVDVTGTTVNFALTDTKNVIVKAQFDGIRDAADTDITAFYALSIDGTDHKMGALKLSLSGGFNGRWPIHLEKVISLAVGSHTVKLRLKSDGTHNSRIASDTDSPTVVTVQYIV